MPYPEALVAPMRAELTRLGVKELRDAAAVDAAFGAAEGQTMVLVINSVCGCAAANARPAMALAMQNKTLPDHFVTVFAGQDLEATARARMHLAGIPPSSPFIALFQNEDPVFVLERRHIEGRTAGAIASDLVRAFDTVCGTNGAPMPDQEAVKEDAGLPSTFRSIL